MESQNSVAKKIIWVVSMIVLCTFLAFFMSMFLGSAFPDMNIIYKGMIPVLVFVALGLASYGIKNYLMPYLDDLDFPKVLKKVMPFLFLFLGLFVGQMYYDEHSKTEIVKAFYQSFVSDGKFYQISGLNLESIYQGGLDFVCILLGNTIFAVGFYNKIYLAVIALFLFFALKNVTGQRLEGNLFILAFLLGQQVLSRSVYPDASLVYVLMVSLYVFILSCLYKYRVSGEKKYLQVFLIVLSVLMLCLLLFIETNSIVWVIPMLAVSFSGMGTQEKKWCLLSGIVTALAVIVVCGAMFVLKPMLLLDFGFEIPTIGHIGFDVTALLVLNLLGFMGIFGMWKAKLSYIIPAFMGIYFVFCKEPFASGISGDVCTLLCFALFAALGVGVLMQFSREEEEICLENGEETKKEDKVEDGSTPETTVSDMANQEEIQNIQALNAKLNEVQAGFVPKTFAKPKRVEKKAPEYAYEPTPAEMKFDIEISDNDDFDI